MTEHFFSFYDAPQFKHVHGGKIHFASMKQAKSVSVSDLFEYIRNDKTTEELTRELRALPGTAEVPAFTFEKVKAEDFDALQLPSDVPVYRHKKADEDGVLWVQYARPNGTTKQKGQFKNTRFSFVQFAGVFSYRNSTSLVTPSGLWCVDFDHFARTPEELAQAKDALLADDKARPCLVFTSPSGDGLKAVYLFDFVADEVERKARLRGLYAYLKSRFNWTQYDGAHAGESALDCYTDAVHCCNVPHDADARLNKDAFTRLDWTLWRVEEERKTSAAFFSSDDDSELNAIARWCVNEVLNSGVDVTEGMTAEQFTAFAASCKSLPDGESIFHALASVWPNYNRADAQATFRSAQTHTSPRLLVKLCNKATGKNWHRDSVDGQEAERQRKEAFLASDDGKKWLEAQRQKRLKQKNSQEYMKDEPQTTALESVAPGRTNAALNDRTLTEAELCELVLRPQTAKELTRTAAQIAASVPTKFVFGYEEQEPLTLKAQALTVIGAATSHGKTRLLENLLVDVAQDDSQDGTCLFFTLEESLSDVLAELVNLFANYWPVRKPKDGTRYTNNFAAYTDAFKRLAASETNLAEAKKFFADDAEFAKAHTYILQFFDKFTKTDRVRLFDDERFRDVDFLCSACRAFARAKKLKVVFLDHLGMMTEHGAPQTAARTERVERIVTKLEQLAKELNVPFVLTQQLSRSASGALKLENGLLADSADVERSANTVVLLWNSSVLPLADYTNKELQKKNGFVDTSDDLKRRGFFYGLRGSLFAKMTKRRGGLRDLWTVLDFNGATGKIQPMTDEQRLKLQEKFQKQMTSGTVSTPEPGTTSGTSSKVHLSQRPDTQTSLEEYNGALTPENVERLNEQLQNGGDNSLHDTDQFTADLPF